MGGELRVDFYLGLIVNFRLILPVIPFGISDINYSTAKKPQTTDEAKMKKMLAEMSKKDADKFLSKIKYAEIVSGPVLLG